MTKTYSATSNKKKTLNIKTLNFMFKEIFSLNLIYLRLLTQEGYWMCRANVSKLSLIKKNSSHIKYILTNFADVEKMVNRR